jgi:hypothetical protein
MFRRVWVDNCPVVRFGFREKYMTIDPRGLGIGRIMLATALIVDLARRLPFATLWYSNKGLLPNHTVLWRPTCDYVFSLFFTASRPYEAMIGFGLCAAVYFMLLIGQHTRLAQLGSLLAVISLHGRVLFIQNSGDVVLVELCVWTSFLPLGRRYSIDALRGRVPRGSGPDDLSEENIASPDRRPVVSWAVFALVAQLAVIYGFNAAQKSGPEWRNGTAVHYVLYYANVVTALGVWVRAWMTPRISQVLSWSALSTEAVLPLLLLTPVARRPARWLAIALVAGLHTGFGLFLNLGMFVPAMFVFTPFLVPASDWDRLEAFWASSSLGKATHRLVARILKTLSHRRLLSPRTCGPRISTSEALWPSQAAKTWGHAREAAAVTLMAVATCGVLWDNPDLTHLPPEREPEVARAVLGYLQMFQIWEMFAPNVATTEQTVAVDALTADGRHVDPLNEALSPGHPFPAGAIPSRLGNNGFASAYLSRLTNAPDYFAALGEWLLNYPKRTHRAADRIVSFRVFAVEQTDPPPGQRNSGKPRWETLFKYPDQ